MKRQLLYWLLLCSSILFFVGCSDKSLHGDSVAPSLEGKTSIKIFHSKKLGDYKLSIYSPSVKAPSQGWPVIYLLDGDSFFKHASEMIRQQAIIVSIDYPTTSRRDLDYLPKPPELSLEILSNGQINIPKAFGGADEFLAFLQTELKPFVYKNYHVNDHKQIIFGHSYGGLFVLHTLFTQPDAFSDYIASSPSIWFSGRYIMQEATYFLEQLHVQQLNTSVTLHLSVGEYEQSLTGQEGFRSDIEKQLRLKHMQNRRMVDNTKELAQMLIQANNPNLEVTYHVYPQQTHQSVPGLVLQDRLPHMLKK